MAQEMGVDLAKIIPTGQGGRVTKEDVQDFVARSAAAQAPAAAPQQPAPVTRPVQPVPPPPAIQAPPTSPVRPAIPEAAGLRSEERVRMSRRRQTIARRLVEVHQVAAMLTTFNEIDMTAVVALRKKRREGFKERFGVDLGYMSFFVKATIGALKAFPYLNAEIQGDEIVIKHYYDIGIAIGAEEGLVVPVIRDADRLNFAGIEQAIRLFAEKVQNNTLSLDDLRGGTITITNVGVFGVDTGTPILNPGESAILALGAIRDMPWVVDGAVVPRKVCQLALSFDHRHIDGQLGSEFLADIGRVLADPATALAWS